MSDRVWMLPAEIFTAAWNNARSLAEVEQKMKAVVGIPVPRSSIISRAAVLRLTRSNMKVHAEDPAVSDSASPQPSPVDQTE